MSMKQKEKTREEIMLQKKELFLQWNAKLRHAERNYRLHYSTKYYRKYAPEDLERHWIEDIEKMKRRVVEYERRIAVEENSK